MEGVGAPVGGASVAEIGGVPTSERRQLVAQRLLEHPRHDASIGATADELFFQLFIHALRTSRRGQRRGGCATQGGDRKEAAEGRHACPTASTACQKTRGPARTRGRG